MKSVEDARALCQDQKDNFYVTAFMIEAWLGDAVLVAATEYAEKKNARDRAMQNGHAWHGFQRTFGHAGDAEFGHILQSLFRFTEYDDVQATMLLQAIRPVAVEHDYSGDFIGPKTLNIAKKPSEAFQLARRTVERWCDWLDSLIHFQTHEIWHLAPVLFDPDAENRELASLGVNQRAFAHLSDFSRNWWEWHHAEASVRFKDSPKWQMIGKAMTEQKERAWNHPELDNAVISLWPLLKRHNWSYRDLMAVARMILPPPHRYPLEREQDLAAYCQNVLGLRKQKGPPGKSAADGKPPGHEVALRLCRDDPSAGSS